MADKSDTDAFIARWQGVKGPERANYQLFVADLCLLLGVPVPDPAREDTRDNAYVFERRITFAHGDGSTSPGFIDCYRRGAFVLEAKKVKAAAHTKGFDDALMRARSQAEGYARALPAAEGRPPFLVVVDVGHVIELYAEFTRSGATYTPFPDPRNHRIRLNDLRDEAVRARLRKLWLDPLALDPSRASAKVTRDVAAKLAVLARELGAAGHAAEPVAAFLTRCLFSMFAEDVDLLPKVADAKGAFSDLLQRYRDDPGALRQMLRVLWADMDHGGFSPALAKQVLRFNGKLFKGSARDDYVLPLTRRHIDLLLDAASSNWREVEPAIFGTLLENALDPDERHALGAHYTPRAYVERLVLPTVVEPLRADWADAQAAALLLATEANALEGKKRDDKLAEARAEVKRFHHRLCTTRVLDPACGSGNFLYVTLEHLKRLEGEVLNQLDALGQTQGVLGFAGETVTPQQLLGIEVNERAAAVAELVLWIGYLQWHIRTFGHSGVAEPVIHDYGNIEHRDAVLAWDTVEPMRDEAGALVQRWDGKTYKAHPVTGEQLPDSTALVPQLRYVNPRPAEWPAADFIVGNPPFIGNKRMREALGDGYVEAIRRAVPSVPESADFVMYWWDRAAELARSGTARRFGLITTNSVHQTFNRRVVGRHLENAQSSLSIVFAIPDHPWVDSSHGAAVRIAMTVGASGASAGRLLRVANEVDDGDGARRVDLLESFGLIASDLSIGLNRARIQPLTANAGLSFMGVILVGDGFFLDDAPESVAAAIRAEGASSTFVSGTDLQKRPRNRIVVDLTGLSEEAARRKAPTAYQWVTDRVKPVRAQNRDKRFREVWWQFGAPRPVMRAAVAGLRRFIVTGRTARHRVFQFLDAGCVVESNAVVIASSSSLLLGVLSAAVHVDWAAWTGATLEDRPHYTNSTIFDPFPFPSDDTGLTTALADRIRNLAEELDAHRKARQAEHDDLTLTSMYNVLEKLRTGAALTAKEKVIHDTGLVSVLRSLHDDLDAAVLAAYGWCDLEPALADHAHAEARAAAVETLLERLVALNAKRAAEEATGTVRWLRPEFQQRGAAAQAAIDTAVPEADADDEAAPLPPPASAPAAKRPWPTGLAEQVKAVADVMTGSSHPLALADLESRFTARGRWRERLPVILDTLEALGRVRRVEGTRWQAG